MQQYLFIPIFLIEFNIPISFEVNLLKILDFIIDFNILAFQGLLNHP